MKCLIRERLSEHKYKTPEGYLICVDSILARTGKQAYRRSELFQDGDDSEVEVDRPENEVFSPATLASFENKPIVVEHPDEDVNANNIKQYAVGFVRDVKRGKTADGQDVMLGTLVIQDAQTIEEIENGEHTDLSCGYDCDIADDANPTQRNIRGNHVALCAQGRAGIAKIVDSVKTLDFDAQLQENKLSKTSIEYRKKMTEQPNNKKSLLLEAENIIEQIVDDTDEKDKATIQRYADKHLSDIRAFAASLKDSTKDAISEEYKGWVEKINSAANIYDEYRREDTLKVFMSIIKNDKALSYVEEDELIRRIKRFLPIRSAVDSIDDSTQEDWFRLLSRNNIAYSFVKGGYGMRFRSVSDYNKAKDLAKQAGYTAGHWHDDTLEHFEYSSTVIKNEDSIKEKDSMIKDAKYAIWVKEHGQWKPWGSTDREIDVAKLKEQFRYYEDARLMPNDGSKPQDSINDASVAFNGFAYMIKQYSSRPEQLITVAAKIKSANDLTAQEKQELLSRIESVKDTSIEDAYNKFANEKDVDFLKESLSEMRRYERNWSGMSAREKQNIAPGGISELRENIRNAEARLKQLNDSDTFAEVTKSLKKNEPTVDSIIDVVKAVKAVKSMKDAPALIPAQNVPEHIVFRNRVKPEDLVQSLRKSTTDKSFEQVAIGNIAEIIADFKADISNPKLDRTKVIAHYREYRRNAEHWFDKVSPNVRRKLDELMRSTFA